MRAALVRVGIDHSYGGWNSPADPITRTFVYVPIPESRGTRFHSGCKRMYPSTLPAVSSFADEHGLDPLKDLGWPVELNRRAMHLDPDFETLTYGDVGNRRGSYLSGMTREDVIVFYAGLRSIYPDAKSLVYAIVGLFVVDEVVHVSDVEPHRVDENAHTRKLKLAATDIVVRAVPERSGRLERYLPIGEYRDRAYRVRRGLLKKWGGLSVRDGYIQRSAVPPKFLHPKKFLGWVRTQGVTLIRANNPVSVQPPVIIVHLRRPHLNNPSESRADPFWEFGSFGCTGCHRTNLMNPAKADQLQGARLAFAQGGPEGFRLVKLTPPVSVERHRDRVEVRWAPAKMPFKYQSAPLLVDNDGETDFIHIRQFVEGVNKTTWMGKFSSKFRSNRTPLPVEAAREVIAEYERLERSAARASIADTYEQALPFAPPSIDRTRKRTYARFRSRIRTSRCRKRTRKAN